MWQSYYDDDHTRRMNRRVIDTEVASMIRRTSR